MLKNGCGHRAAFGKEKSALARPLQAATSSGKPILLRTSNASGHGIGSSLDEKIGESVDVYAFLFDRLGVAYRPLK